MHIQFFRNSRIVKREEFRLFYRVAPEVVEPFILCGHQAWWRHNKDRWADVGARPIVLSREVDETLHAHGSIKGAATAGIFYIIRAQHDDDQIKRLMRFQSDGKAHGPIAIFLCGRIIKHRSAPVHAFFDDAGFVVEARRQNVWPAIIVRHAHASGRVITPGERVTECENGFHETAP